MTLNPFEEVEPDLRLAIELTARRKESGAVFADLLKRLIELCRNQGYRAAQSEHVIKFDGRGMDPEALVDSLKRLGVGSEPVQGETGTQQLQNGHDKEPTSFGLVREAGPEGGVSKPRNRDEAMERYRAAHPDKTPKPEPPRPKPARLSENVQQKTQIKEEKPVSEEALIRGHLREDQKKDIRRRYRALPVDGDPQAAKKWLEHIAKEYKKSVQYIYKVIYSDPDFVAVPPQEGAQA